MQVKAHLAKHFHDVHFGGNWTDVNLKTILQDVTWEEAQFRIYDLNTIGILVYHINYYVAAVLKVLQGEKLVAHDQYSFDIPLIQNEADWQKLLSKLFEDAENFTSGIENLHEDMIFSEFEEGKYGNYYRNLQGIIEHTHYHLGQITLIKRMIRAAKAQEFE